MRALVLLVPLLTASIARAAEEAPPLYDDRVMMDQVAKALASIRGRWQDPDQATADQSSTVALHLCDLRALDREVGAALRSRDAPEEILTHRHRIKSRLETFLSRVHVYRNTCHLHASARKKLKAIKRAEPPKPS